MMVVIPPTFPMKTLWPVGVLGTRVPGWEEVEVVS